MNNLEKLMYIENLLIDMTIADTGADEAVRDRFTDTEVLIYGAGSFGKEMLAILLENGIKVCGFLDKNAEKIKELCGYRVSTLEAYNGDKSKQTVVMAIVCDKDVRKKIITEIKASGFTDVIEAQSIRCMYVNFGRDYNIDGAFNKIRFVFDRFCDEKSRQIFLDNIIAHLLRSYSDDQTNESSMYEQYFPSDIDLPCGYSAFIDCGGFTGDTVEQLMKEKSPKRVVSFEPFPDNFERLTSSCQKYNGSSTEFTLMNNAVSNAIYRTSFKSGTGSGTISSNGDIKVMAVSLDKVLRGFKPTFIKMDIEGEELNALHGAEQMIRTSAPDMAICVYHNIEHIWEIPYYIASVDNGYNFYLRRYNSYTMETVVYAHKKNGGKI